MRGVGYEMDRGKGQGVLGALYISMRWRLYSMRYMCEQ